MAGRREGLKTERKKEGGWTSRVVDRRYRCVTKKETGGGKGRNEKGEE